MPNNSGKNLNILETLAHDMKINFKIFNPEQYFLREIKCHVVIAAFSFLKKFRFKNAVKSESRLYTSSSSGPGTGLFSLCLS